MSGVTYQFSSLCSFKQISSHTMETEGRQEMLFDGLGGGGVDGHKIRSLKLESKHNLKKLKKIFESQTLIKKTVTLMLIERKNLKQSGK